MKLEVDLARNAAIFEQHLRYTNALGIADLYDLGFHNYIVITRLRFVNRSFPIHSCIAGGFPEQQLSRPLADSFQGSLSRCGQRPNRCHLGYGRTPVWLRPPAETWYSF